MATRNYVGARYVPKFATPVEWQANTSYEALTIVSYYNASYTSKIPVPPTVGNPADNPEYWVVTGNYNAQVEQYRKDTEKVQSDLTAEISNRENADTQLQNNITAEQTARENADTQLQNNITAEQTARENADNGIDQRITNETANLNKTIVTGRRFLLLGDSLSQGYSESEGATGSGWAIKAKADLTTCGYVCYNYTDVSESSQVGNCFANGSWLKTLENYSDNANIDNNKITDIIVFGGSNELNYTTDQLSSEIARFCVYAHTHFPNAKVKIGIVAACISRFANEMDVPAFYKTYSERFGAEYVAGTFYLFRRNDSEYLNAGQTHPTKAGYEYFYPMLFPFILNTNAHFSYEGRSSTLQPSDPVKPLYDTAFNFIVTDHGIYANLTRPDGSLGLNSLTLELTNNTYTYTVKFVSPITLNKPVYSFEPYSSFPTEGYAVRTSGILSYVDNQNPSVTLTFAFNKIPTATALTSYVGYGIPTYQYFRLC